MAGGVIAVVAAGPETLACLLRPKIADRSR